MELLFSLLFSFAQGFAVSPKGMGGKYLCQAREIQRRDCRLSAGSYKVRLLSETIARDDGTWHTVDAMPLFGEGVVWEKMRFDIFKEWPILQLWIWDKGSGEAGVQQLHWFVADIRKGDMKILATGIVRRRRQKLVEVVEGKPAPKATYTLDAWEKHNLKVLKDGNLEWTLGPQTKILEKADHHGI